MHKLSRRDVLCGTGVAALAAAVVPFGLAKADGPISADQVKAQVLALANQLLGDNTAPHCRRMDRAKAHRAGRAGARHRPSDAVDGGRVEPD